MGRSGYSEDGEYQYADLYRASVDRALAGRRGQAFLKELLAAYDAMPEKKLIAESLKIEDGAVCSLGAVAVVRGLDTEPLEHHFEDENYGVLAKSFGIAEGMLREIVYMNDEHGRYNETPERRFERMRAWVVSQINAAS